MYHTSSPVPSWRWLQPERVVPQLEKFDDMEPKSNQPNSRLRSSGWRGRPSWRTKVKTSHCQWATERGATAERTRRRSWKKKRQRRRNRRWTTYEDSESTGMIDYLEYVELNYFTQCIDAHESQRTTPNPPNTTIWFNSSLRLSSASESSFPPQNNINASTQFFLH